MNRTQITLLIVLTGLSSACTTTLQARDVQPSGFLGEDHSLLQTNPEDGALQVYRKPAVTWSAYKKLMLKPLTIWEGLLSKLGNQQRRELLQLAGAFEDRLYLKLSKDYEMVEKPAVGTILIEVVITDTEQHRTGPDFLSRAIPQLQAVGTIWVMGGKPAFAGDIKAEFKVQDAQTNELLAVGAAQPVSWGKLFNSEVFNSRGDVKNSLEFWTDQATYRLRTLRGKTTCVEPRG